MPGVEAKDQQLGMIELLINDKRLLRAQAVIVEPDEAEIIAFRHFGANPGAVRIGAGAFNEMRFMVVFGDDGDALAQRIDLYVVSRAFRFIDGSTHTNPTQLADNAIFNRERMPRLAMTFALHDD